MELRGENIPTVLTHIPVWFSESLQSSQFLYARGRYCLPQAMTQADPGF